MEGQAAYQISISAEVETKIDESLIRRVIIAALAHHAVRAAEIDVTIVDDVTIAHLNQTHLGHDGPTDVLTFDLRDSKSASTVEGQVVLSIDTARREAAARDHSPEAEVALYAVHGVLHLLDYDDDTEERAALMHDREDEILTAAGLSPTFKSKAESNDQM
jgi:probable rRNA maturation factor